MRKNLPSMSSLQAFEATGRHLSFTRAATELGVTQGAVSQRIAKLEAMLGTKLFSREGNAQYLTPIGKEFLVPARAAIVQLAQATDHAVERQHGNVLSIGCLAAFAIKTSSRDCANSVRSIRIRFSGSVPSRRGKVR